MRTSARSFAAGFLCLRQASPTDPSSRKRPCLKLVVVVTRIYKSDHLDVGSPTGDFHPISSRPCWAYTNHCTRPKQAVFREIKVKLAGEFSR